MTRRANNVRSPFFPGLSSWPCAVFLTLFLAEPALASVTFPRGPGFYYNPYKFAFLLAVYFSWISTCSWVSRDIEKQEIPAKNWTLLFLGVGLLGFALLWLLPFFWLALVLFVACHLSAGYWYLTVRDRLVDPEKRILTDDNLRRLLRKHLRISLPKRDAASKDGLDDLEETAPGGDIRFIARGPGRRDDDDEDQDRLTNVRSSKGYRAALNLVGQALMDRATDIHVEPGEQFVTVRYRIDGVMCNQRSLVRAVGDAVVNVFKVIANLNIAEKRKPQDGAFSALVEGRQIDFRVATAGSVSGEKIVIRILDSTQKLLSLGQLGMRDKMRDQIVSIVKNHHGLFLACGPTGAGKTSTLYACLNDIDRYQQNVITIENPVECRLDHVTQIEVSDKAGKTFAGELRSVLRQDPDVIFVGEIRDQETAEIACQAAQTGHLVFSTLHANDCVTALGRLIDLGIEPFTLSTALSGILSQRLVRMLCPSCKVRYKPNPDLLTKAGLPAERIKYFYRPPSAEEVGRPCQACGGAGFLKRTGIFELLVVNDRIRQMLKDNPDLDAIKVEAVKNGLRFLYEDGIKLVIEGKTSLPELLRVSK